MADPAISTGLRGALAALVLVLVLAAGAAQAADPVLGTWQSPPDGKGQVGHVEMTRCGAALCGTLVRAYSADGARVVTPNVGRRLVWGMHAAGGGEYRGGRVYVPIFGRDFAATMELEGDRLTVRGCAGPVCKSQVWRRVEQPSRGRLAPLPGIR